jgi:spore germination protein KC
MKHNYLILSFIIASTTILSGCWSTEELTNLAIISAVGIDKNKEGKYVYTIQMINPGNVAGGLQGGSGGQTPATNALSATGDTIVEASRLLSKKVSRRVYYAHTNLVVVNEQLAKEEGILKILDAIERDPQFRTTATIVIARGQKASDIMRFLSTLDKIPANSVNKVLKNTATVWGEQPSRNIHEVIQDLETPGKETIIPGFQMTGEPQAIGRMESLQQTKPKQGLETSGLAIFKSGKLIDWYEGETARGVSWVLDKIKQTSLTLNWENNKEAIVYDVARQTTKIKTKIQNGQPEIYIFTEAEGDIAEITAPIDLSNLKIRAKIQEIAEKEIKKEMNLAIEQGKKNQTDIFGFGDNIHLSNPQEWKKLQQDWNDVYFPEVKVHVSVKSFIRESGLNHKSYMSDVK